jgi:ABC-2 type transport system ATP-binding protein
MVWQGSLVELAAQQRMRVRVETSDRDRAAATMCRLGLDDVQLDPGGVSGVLGAHREEQVVAALVADGVGVRAFVAQRPDLEEVFVELTGSGFDVSG